MAQAVKVSKFRRVRLVWQARLFGVVVGADAPYAANDVGVLGRLFALGRYALAKVVTRLYTNQPSTGALSMARANPDEDGVRPHRYSTAAGWEYDAAVSGSGVGISRL